MELTKHPAYLYAKKCVSGKAHAPKYVKLQAKEFIKICENNDDDYIIHEEKLWLITELLEIMTMPTGIRRGETMAECSVGYQWLVYAASLCVVMRDNPRKRRYETVILEIARKNFKTFTVAVLFILLFLTEPPMSKFYSVAPDGSLSREVKSAIDEIIKASPALGGNKEKGIRSKFQILQTGIKCTLNDSKYTPLNFSSSRMDGRLPTVFVADEVGALPNSYAVEAMRSGQVNIQNKLGFIISTKYPTLDNPFEDEVKYAKNVLDGVVADETCFALLYEPDSTEDWATDNELIYQANPAAVEIPDIFENIVKKRQKAVAMPSARRNFLTKHLNIIYLGADVEGFIELQDLVKCRSQSSIDWNGRVVYVGVDLSMTNDNTSVVMLSYDEASGKILSLPMCFIPEGRVDEKSNLERVDYQLLTDSGHVQTCGDRTVDYAYIEEYVMSLEEKYGVTIAGIGFDRYNCLSSAQKWENAGYTTIEVVQHSKVLHLPTKTLEESIINGTFCYEENQIYEINFQNARCQKDTNLNKYVSKKKSNGKVDMVVSTIIAMSLLVETVLLGGGEWGVQI